MTVKIIKKLLVRSKESHFNQGKNHAMPCYLR